MSPSRVFVVALLVAALAPSSLTAQQTAAAPATITARTAGLERRAGFGPVYLNDRTGAVWLELPRDSARMLLMTTLATGLGSKALGLDRGSGGGGRGARLGTGGGRVGG